MLLLSGIHTEIQLFKFSTHVFFIGGKKPFPQSNFITGYREHLSHIHHERESIYVTQLDLKIYINRRRIKSVLKWMHPFSK